MTDKLNFSLAESKPPSEGRSYRLIIIINLFILVVACAIFAFILLRSSEVLPPPENGPSLSGEAQKQLALKLERQGLDSVAASAWKQYLLQVKPEKKNAARIWFRIGKLYQDSNQYDKALAAYYRSERFAHIAALSTDIGRRVQECLTSMGKFAALREELAGRVGLKGAGTGGKSAGENTVVAEIGSQKITIADLDHLIDQSIDRQLYRSTPYLPKDAFNREKQKLFEAFSTTPRRLNFLRQYLAETVLYREALASKLLNDPDIRSEIKADQRALLAERELEKTYAKDIHITNGDLETYYQANKKDYRQPEQTKISLIVAKNAAAAQKVRAAVKQGKSFAQLARSYSIDPTSAKNGGRIDQWIRKGQPIDIPEISGNPKAAKLIFTAEAGTVLPENIQGKNGIDIIRVDKRQPGQVQPFNAVKNKVKADLLARKEQEVRTQLLQQLKNKYNVVIHTSAFPPDQQKSAGGNASNQNPRSQAKQH